MDLYWKPIVIYIYGDKGTGKSEISISCWYPLNSLKKHQKAEIYRTTLFKFYESTFETMVFVWIEPHSPAAKISKSSTSSGIVLVDGRVSYLISKLLFMDYPLSINNTIKSLHTELFNLVAILLEHLDCPVER